MAEAKNIESGAAARGQDIPAAADARSLLVILWWLAPVAFLFWLYRDGLKVWFIGDDFAWLGLLRGIHGFHDFLAALFAPQAQGTIRPWSERAFFMLSESLFGLESLPLRICAFITMAANVALVAWIARRITDSRLAGFLAPIFWVANTALIDVMSWNSAFNEALCALFLLLATALFIRWDETGQRKFWWWQLVVFVLGFGALEINVVYPALAAAYALFVAAGERRKRLLVSLTPLFCLSVLYFVLHRMAAPLPASGPYVLHLDGRIFATLATYWRSAIIPKAWADSGHFTRPEQAVFWAATVTLACFLAYGIAKRRYQVLFFVFWFLISLAPMLPLADHLTGYYLTIPMIGVAMLAASGVARAWQSADSVAPGHWVLRIAVAALAVAWLLPMIEASRAGVDWWVDHSRQARALVLGVAAAHESHPGKTIVLDGVHSDLYDETIAESAFYPEGVDDVYLTPGAENRIHPSDNPGMLEKVVLDPAIMRHAVTHEEVVVYSFLGDHLRNTTGDWERNALDDASSWQPRRVEAASPLWAYLLGPEWYGLEPGIRWMPQRATVRLGGPRSAGDRLLLEGFCPEQQLKAGPLHLSVSVDGIPLKNAQIDNPETDFRRLFDMPSSLTGKPAVEVAIGVDRVIHDAGGRELGLVFGTIAIE